MTHTAREEILGRLRESNPQVPPARTPKVGQLEIATDIKSLADAFMAELAANFSQAHRVGDNREAYEKLLEICKADNISRIMVSDDDVIGSTGWLPQLGAEKKIEALTPAMFESMDAFKDAVFDQADAGLTGADFGVAESGTLVLKYNSRHARLVSLAPPIHIAVVPVDRLVGYYEDVIPDIFTSPADSPSQVSMITGPSSTGDIAAVHTFGMHGPKQLTVILVG